MEQADWSEEDKRHVDLHHITREWPQIDVLITWSRVLREALRQRHGGAFIIVPNVEIAPIKRRFPIRSFSLGEKIVEAWLALRRTWRHQPKDDLLGLVDDERNAVHRL